LKTRPVESKTPHGIFIENKEHSPGL
jgi:hypothetical protein